MADIVLGDGREITFDLDKFTEREWRFGTSPTGTQEDLDAIAAKATGLTVDEILNLTKQETKKFWRVFVRKVREPLSDPN